MNDNKDLIGDDGDGWCPLSERRLLHKLAYYKPAGVNRELNMIMLSIFMNNIFDFEEDINFEDYLSEHDFEVLKRRRLEVKVDPKNPMAFAPTYNIRPTIVQIRNKLSTFYDIELIQENELIPELMEKQSNFDLSKFMSLPMPNTSFLDPTIGGFFNNR